MNARAATPGDAAAIAHIYNQGIEDRVATFETRPCSADDIRAWFDGVHPIIVVEDSGRVIAFASTSTYRARECYAGIAETSVYVERSARRQRAGNFDLLAHNGTNRLCAFSVTHLDRRGQTSRILEAGFAHLS
jgi:phosphinothricin acetyltransferase